MGSFLTPGWATVCAKKNHTRNAKEYKVVLVDFNKFRTDNSFVSSTYLSNILLSYVLIWHTTLFQRWPRCSAVELVL